MSIYEAGRAPSTEEASPRQKLDISLVVSMYNSQPETLKVIQGLFLPSLLNNLNSKTQLVIVDDGSPLYDETTKVVNRFLGDLKNRAGDVVHSRLEPNRGFAGAYNSGIQQADGKVIIILNDDIYLPKGSVESLANVLTLDSNTGAVGPVIDNSWSFQGINLFGRIADMSPEQLQRIEDFSTWLRKVMEGKRYILNGSRREVLLGASLAFKREVYDVVGPLDERYTYGTFEDADWERRVKLAGYDLIVDAAAFVEHGGQLGGTTSLRQHPEKMIKAMISNAFKYGKKWNCLSELPRDLVKGMLQGYGLMSVQGEIVRTAKEKGLWKEYLRDIKLRNT